MTTPLDYGIRLNKFRENQLETIKEIGSLEKKHIVVSAITGSGKSLLGMALAKELNFPIRAITKTRSLQDQYADSKYGADALYGLAAYDCALVPNLRASECVFPHNMKDCPRSGSCKYLQNKNKMLASQKQVISYAYWFNGLYLRDEKYAANIYFDECHDIPTTAMSHLEKLFDRGWEKVVKIRLKKLPSTSNQDFLKKMFLGWLIGVVAQLKEEEIYLRDRLEGDKGAIKRYTTISRELTSLEAISFQLENFPEEMIVIVNDDSSILVAPLSARMFRGTVSSHYYEKAIFTSATVGNPNTLMGALGFRKDEFDFIDVPSRFPPESMPVYVPPESPRMNYRSGEAAYKKQADMIYDIISESPSNWSGFIHTASIAHAKDLASRLANKGLRDRIWMTPQGSSSHKIQAWELQKSARPNTIVVSWDMWTGIDGFDEEINIITKVPYGTLDILGKARMERDRQFYIWEAASKIEQAVGRNRRGDEDHYEKEGEPTRRIGVILDSNVFKVYNQFSPLMRARIIKSNVEIKI